MAIGGVVVPRAARKKSESGIYHIMVRGINRQTIFEDEEDCEKYLQCLRESKALSGFTLMAYCLMGNHAHLLLQEGREPLEQIFKRIGARYVFWYNWKYKRSGHLFQDRFKSEPVNDDSYFLAVLRYIYQNPVKAGLCKSARDYQWSSYRLIGQIDGLVSDEMALGLLPPVELETFVNEPTQEQHLDMQKDARLTDQEAIELMKRLCHAGNTSEFQRLPREQQAVGVKVLQEHGCSIRQIVRIAGTTKAVVERMLQDG